MPQGIVNLKLIVNLDYRLNNTRVSELEKALGRIVINAASQGDFTHRTAAEVKTWGWKVSRTEKGARDGKAKKPCTKKSSR